MEAEVKVTERFNAANQAVHEGVKKGLKAVAFAIVEEAMEKGHDYGFHPDGQRVLIDTGAMINRGFFVEADGVNQREEAKAAALAANPEGQEAAEGTEIDTETQAKVGNVMEYAIYHEMGTVDIPARPFLGPAAKVLEGKVEGIVAKFVRDEVRKATR